MAKYVLLSFDSDAEADAFVQNFDNHRAFYTKDDGSYGMNSPETFVRGVYKKPTKFCDCAKTGHWGRREGFTKGRKYGWWVHARCGRPRQAWAEGDHWYTALGRNLLPTTPRAPEWRGDGVRGHEWDPEEKAFRNVKTGELKK